MSARLDRRTLAMIYSCSLHCPVGIVREVGRRIFHCRVKCEVVERRNDIGSVITGVDGHTFKEYVKFEVTITTNGSVLKDKPISSSGQCAICSHRVHMVYIASLASMLEKFIEDTSCNWG